MGKKLKITLVRSKYGWSKKQRATIAGLGLRKIGHTVVRPDNPCIRGMVEKVRHLVKVEEINE
ncbi:50S ribosomal protein L30 [Thermosulfurimonas dismutans]|uniref:50S ribosomal protein L30 n=1 Tax=Thermosulfurimonas dismutans TaxID=999894 RepID=A0A179D5K7_9BACT|nr:50S ribosomal protein L30 [Thermosulfurimonas dismutans]OAQ21071.1 LSU ribosomal protein L30p (L7e) [Thermosulfurimonas dismutans]HIE33228.1 50S ribosomal protein L30 [Thermodesulfobacteriaceae bacterium]